MPPCSARCALADSAEGPLTCELSGPLPLRRRSELSDPDPVTIDIRTLAGGLRRGLHLDAAVTNAWQSVLAVGREREDRDLLRPGRHSAGPGGWFEAMPADECWRRLRAGSVGRLAFVINAGAPAVLPVNYAVDDTRIVLRSGRGPKLAAAMRRDNVAFEIDEIDSGTKSGWSVVVLGRARLVHDAAEEASLGRLQLTPWASGPREQFVVIEPKHVSGRVLHPEGDATEQRESPAVQVQSQVTVAAVVAAGDDMSDVSKQAKDRDVVGEVGRRELVDATVAGEVDEAPQQGDAEAVVLPVLGHLDRNLRGRLLIRSPELGDSHKSAGVIERSED